MSNIIPYDFKNHNTLRDPAEPSPRYIVAIICLIIACIVLASMLGHAQHEQQVLERKLELAQSALEVLQMQFADHTLDDSIRAQMDTQRAIDDRLQPERCYISHDAVVQATPIIF